MNGGSLFSSKKGSGFGTVVSFIFVFFIIASVISFMFFTLITDAKNKLELVEKNKDITQESSQSFELSSPFYSSGRMSFFINNTGNEIGRAHV